MADKQGGTGGDQGHSGERPSRESTHLNQATAGTEVLSHVS
ncbi:mCG59572, isoform CRA_a [Mus musculus]|nr:mCG59572, isoform CRA_a [Mus musculus]